MKSRTGRRNRISLGSLISALYEEAAAITGDRKLQTVYVCLALMDMQHA